MTSTPGEGRALEAARQGKEKAIAAMLGKLALHYWRPDFTPAQAKQLYGDYVRHLAPYPLKDIQDSIDAYQATSGSKFYPLIGQLLAPITTRPKWDTGSNESYARERQIAGDEELQRVVAQIESDPAPKQIAHG